MIDVPKSIYFKNSQFTSNTALISGGSIYMENILSFKGERIYFENNQC